MFKHRGGGQIGAEARQLAMHAETRVSDLEQSCGISKGSSYSDALYTKEEADTLIYNVYTSALNYRTIGTLCTLDGHVDKVEGWLDVFYSIPFAPIEYSATVGIDEEGVLYIVDTGSIEGNPVLRIRRMDNTNMVREALYNNQVKFSLTYRYK